MEGLVAKYSFEHYKASGLERGVSKIVNPAYVATRVMPPRKFAES